MRCKLFRLEAENFCRLLKTFVVENTGFSTQRRSAHKFMNIYASSVIKIREENFMEMKIVIPTAEFIIFLFIKLSQFLWELFPAKNVRARQKNFFTGLWFLEQKAQRDFHQKVFRFLPASRENNLQLIRLLLFVLSKREAAHCKANRAVWRVIIPSFMRS